MSRFEPHNQPVAPVTEIYVWLGKNRDGDEGIISGDYETPWGLRLMPLLSHRREQAEGYKEAAEHAQAEGAKAGYFFEVSMVTFIRTT